jgi:hypothetical protein
MRTFTPRQVAVRAQEAASQLLAALDREALVARFLHSYARENKRPGRTADPERYRELMETIRREALLVLVLQIEAEAPARLGVRNPDRVTPTQAKLLDLFREEFYVALGRSLEWRGKDLEDFYRDLDLYRRLYAALPPRPRRPRSPAASSPRGPFADRCGLLLDPPMLEQARRAAAKFESELIAVSNALLKKVFSRSAPR